MAKEMITYNRSELQIQISDISKHNQFLSDKITSDYYGVFNNICSAFNTFMEDKVDSSSGKKYFFRINLDPESKKSKMMWSFLYNHSWKTQLVSCYCAKFIDVLFYECIPRVIGTLPLPCEGWGYLWNIEKI